MSFEYYSNKSCEEIENEFGSSIRQGLSPEQLIKNKKKYGSNVLLERKRTWVGFLISQYKSPLIWLLLAASLISLFVKEYVNAITIFFIVIVNTLISFYQEYRASKEVELLEKYLEHKSKILRSGQEFFVESKKLVPGDVIILEPGDYIPADMRMLEDSDLMVDESILSGELVPVRKYSKKMTCKPKNMFTAYNIGFSGTSVVSGKGKGIIFSIGQATTFGKISDLTVTTVRETKFFQNVSKISFLLIRIIAVTFVLLILAHLFLHFHTLNFIEIVMFAVALSVGITPEALPAIITISLARGARLLMNNKVIVKRLSSIEDLGGLEILCTDKTGTITENKLSIEDVNSPSDINTVFYRALSGSRAFDKKKRPLNPFDNAVWEKLSDSDFDNLLQYDRIEYVPFDSKHRRSLVLVRHNLDYVLISNGDFEEVAKRSLLSEEEKKELRLWIKSKAKNGCRVIAIAKKDIPEPNNKSIWDYENDMEFVGLIALFDPIKKTVTYALKEARRLGLEIKIITGDGADIAAHIAYEIGLISNIEDVITGEEFADMNEFEKERVSEVISVFARFLPEQKYEVIKLLKKNKSVGYLGDGINDAPSLKEANVGLAVQGATDIAREAADIVLLKKSLSTIVDGIVIGRRVFINTANYLKITLASNLGNFYSMAIISLFIPFLPLLPLQILLVNFLSDSPMIAISTDNVNTKELERPTNYNLRHFVFFIVIFGLISSIFDFVFFFNFYKESSPKFLQTNWFIFSILTEILFIFSGRTKLFFTKAVTPSFWLLLFSVISMILTIIIPFTKIGKSVFSFINPTFSGLISMIIIGIAYFISCEIFKFFYYNFMVSSQE